MDRPGGRTTRPHLVLRASESTRLQRQAMAAAYERIYPVFRRALGKAAPHPAVEDPGESRALPRAAAGA